MLVIAGHRQANGFQIRERFSSFLPSRHAKGAAGASAAVMWHSLTFYTSFERRRVMQRTQEGEVNLILLLRHRPMCSDSNMSNRLSKNPHLFGWEQVSVCVCMFVFQRNCWGKHFSLLSAPMHLTVCIRKAVFLSSISTLIQYPPNTNIGLCHLYFPKQHGAHFSHSGRVLPHFILIWISGEQATLCN